MVSRHHRGLVRHLLHHHHHHRAQSPALLCRFYRDAPGTNKLRDVWPLLEDRFRDLVRDHPEGLFELLPTSHQAALLQRVVTNKIHDTETTTKVAAVLVLLLSVDGRPSLVFTRRSAHLSQHAAQISFPGGHYDAALDGGDGDDDGDDQSNHRHLIRTALREAQEELYPRCPPPDDDDDGSSAAPRIIHDFWTTHVKILGVGTPLPSIRGVLVHPVFAGLLDHDDDLTSTTIETMWPGHPDEVDQVFTVPVCDLLTNETTQYLPATPFNPSDRRAPVYPTSERIGGTIWGLTAHILRPTLHRLFRPILCCRHHNDDEHEQQQQQQQQEQPSNQQ